MNVALALHYGLCHYAYIVRKEPPDLSGRATNAGRSLQPYYGVVARLTNRDLGLHRIRVPGDAALSELE